MNIGYMVKMAKWQNSAITQLPKMAKIAQNDKFAKNGKVVKMT